MIFLDGDHSAEVVYQEIPLALRRLEPPGLIMLHDYFPDQRPLWPGREPVVGPNLGVGRIVSEGAGLRHRAARGSALAHQARDADDQPSCPHTGLNARPFRSGRGRRIGRRIA